LSIPDYTADIPIYSKLVNFYTSQHIQLLTGCLLFPVLPDMLIKCIKAPSVTGSQQPALPLSYL